MMMQGQRRFTRTEVVQAIMQYCHQSTNVMVSRSVNIDETPEQLRHSCMQTGVCFLPMFKFPVEDMEYPDLNLPFYYCQKCGTLYVYRSLYD